ncbi:inorganic phosphate transporter [Agriterribacter humi]|jgi:PiT family inorganic phosphate transporter|uniref:inorganic phosphate transporter n=1 Tax=Agriterribacter humi TaxID=1104781 RepID=UPI0012651876|nr:inorganic phosphate transporter [Agriterribacter humi]
MTLLVVIIILALLFDYINGFHDAANSIATIVSTKVLTPFQAVLWAALFNFVAFFIFKDHGVANTIAKTVKESYITLQVVLAGLSAAIIWNLITWWFGIPSSSSHTLIGGFTGAAIAHAGFYAVNAAPVLQIVAFIFLAPLVGMIMAFIISLWFIHSFQKSIWPKLFSIAIIVITIVTLSQIMEFDPAKLKSHYDGYIMKVIFHSHNFKLVLLACIIFIMCIFTLYLSKLNAHRSTVWFKRLQLVSSAAFSIGHGGNDAQKVMGIITVALISHGSIQSFDEMPFWVPIACYTAIALGTLSGGWKIVKTMGSRITKVTPFEGVAAETAGAITLFVTEHLKIPVSTTHTIAGAIMGVGATKRLSAVRWGVTVNLLWAWIITIPISALMAAIIYWLSHFFF